MSIFRKKPTDTGRQRIREGGGDGDSPKFSYHASRRAEQDVATGRHNRPVAPRQTIKRVWRFWLERTGLLILLVVVVIALVNVLTVSTDAKIIPDTSGSSGSFLRSQATYQAAANKLLSSSLWNRNKITIDTAKFSHEMQAQFPELANVSVTLPLVAHRPLVYIQPTQPAAVLTASNGSYVLDTNGKALLPSSQLASASKLPQVIDQSGIQVRLNRQVLTADDVNFIQTVAGQLAAHHVSISQMVLPAASRELDVHIAGQPYFIKFNLENNDARQQAGTYLATAAQLQSQHVTPAQYIDVRVDGRAYYQ